MIIRCQDSAGQATGKAHVCFIKHPKGSTLARGLTWRNLRKAGKFKKNKSTSSTTIFCGPWSSCWLLRPHLKNWLIDWLIDCIDAVILHAETERDAQKQQTWAHRSDSVICRSRSSASRHMLQPSPSNAMLLINTKVLPFTLTRRTDGDENALANLCRWRSLILQHVITDSTDKPVSDVICTLHYITTVTSYCCMMSSVTWPFNSPWALPHRLPIGNNPIHLP